MCQNTFIAKDIYHNEVKEALEADGWKITHDPYRINLKGLGYEADLGAEKLFGAERADELGLNQIVVEIKSFTQSSLTYEFHRALGQYMSYILGLRLQDPERKLYLAIPSFAYKKILKVEGFLLLLEEYKVKIIIFKDKKIIQWER